MYLSYIVLSQVTSVSKLYCFITGNYIVYLSYIVLSQVTSVSKLYCVITGN